MLRVHDISDLSHPLMQPYLAFREDARHRRQGIFIAEGAKITERLLESEHEIVSLLLPEAWLEKLRPLIDSKPYDIHAFVGPKPELAKMVGLPMFQGVNSVGRIPANRTFEDLIATARQPRLFVATDELTGADNMGAIVRNAVAFGADALIVGDTCCSAWVRKAVRTSMGTAFDIKIQESKNLPETLARLREDGVRIIAAHAHADQKTISDCDLQQDICLVMGGEGHGFRESVLAACDDHAIIPMANGVDSLNVGSAASVFLYEVARQRGFNGAAR